MAGPCCITTATLATAQTFTAFQTLQTVLTPFDEAAQRDTRLMEVKIAPGDLLMRATPATVSVPTGATGVGVAQTPAITPNFPPEIIQFINLCQFGWGAQLGANKRISHQTAVMLLNQMLTSYLSYLTSYVAQSPIT